MDKLELLVAEAKHRDAGRSIARIHNEDMQKLGLISGDIVEIRGKKTACAITWHGYPDDAEGMIRIDGDIRSNAGVGIDDKVEIQKTEASKASRITLAPSQEIRLIRGEDYLAKVLEGRPVLNDQKIRIEVLGSPILFAVIKTDPEGIVIVGSDTTITLKEKPVAIGPDVTYEDIGGLRREIRLVREMIELPLRYPELFQRIGIDPPKGVLLFGPPGTGKTLIAKAVANEVEAYFISISGPELISKWYGESEQRLREVFDEAEKNAPSIIFIDEIDSIAPKRDEMTGERQLERRVVSQLLSLMDGLKSRGQVVVIAATNKPDILDEALRRGGRFDREIEIGVPNKDGRKEILHVHTRGMPLAEDVDLDELSSITHGFVGADLAMLCKEAGMHALRKIIPEIDIEKNISSDILNKIEIIKDDFYDALKGIEPSALREVFVEIPDIGWDDIGGLEKAKHDLIEAVEWPLKYPELYEYSKTKTPKGILLFGPPGTGKTLLAKALANESQTNFISIKGPELISKYIGESEKRLREVFRKAKQASPCIIFIDELDAVAPVRGSRNDSGVSERFVSQLLTELDGIEELKGVILLGATNRSELIDPALLRSGRFERLLEIGVPDEKAREEIFRIHCKGKPLEFDARELAKTAENLSGADIASICELASRLSIREFVKDKNKDEIKDRTREFVVKREHFEAAFQEFKSKK